MKNPIRPEVTISATANCRNQNRRTIFFSDHAAIIMCLGGGVKCDRSVQLSSAVVAVPNVKVEMEAQHSIPSLSLRDLLRESYTFTFTSCLLHATESFLRS